jgi:hypothetical protein
MREQAGPPACGGMGIRAFSSLLFIMLSPDISGKFPRYFIEFSWVVE